MVMIDQERCIGCGTCIQDCIAGALSLRDGRASAAENCLLCGHCVAICPECAVSIPAYEMEDVEEYSSSAFDLEPQRLLRAIKFRRSIRNYHQRMIEREKLRRIVEAGRYSATARNTQGCRFIVVQEEVRTLKKMIWQNIGDALDRGVEEAEPFRRFYEAYRKNPAEDFLFRNAPAVIYIAAEHTLDAGLAAQNMELMAVSQGLGILYNGYLRRATVLAPEAASWLDTGEKPLAACMLVGYPAAVYQRTAPRRKADAVWK